MNRLKKELHRKGIRLAKDYPELPYFIKGKSIFESGYIFVDDVVVESETATVYVYLNVLVETYTLLRNGNVERGYR